MCEPSACTSAREHCFFFHGALIRSGGRFHTNRACAKVLACAIWAINFAVEEGGVRWPVHCFDHFVKTGAERLLCVCVYVEKSWLNSSRVLSDMAHEIQQHRRACSFSFSIFLFRYFCLELTPAVRVNTFRNKMKTFIWAAS